MSGGESVKLLKRQSLYNFIGNLIAKNTQMLIIYMYLEINIAEHIDIKA